MALTHSILINLFIKLELNNFSLPPLLSIVFLQEWKVFEGETRKAYNFARKMESLGTSLSSTEVSHFGFMCFPFVNM